MPTTSNSYAAELSTIQVASQHVQDVSAQIQSELSKLYSQIEPLTSSWQGQAAASFQALHERWQNDANKINTVLGQISEGLLVNFKSYTDAETTNSQQMNATAGQL